MKRKIAFVMILCAGMGLCACGRRTVTEAVHKVPKTSVCIMPTESDADICSVQTDKTDSRADSDRTQTGTENGNRSGTEDWRQAYLAYLDTLEAPAYFVYSLIYVDDDNIPELVVDSGFDYNMLDGGCQALLTFHGCELDEWKPIRSRFTYIERANLICNVSGIGDDSEYNSHRIYTIEDGKWTYAGGGYREWQTRGFAFMEHAVCEYYWDEDSAHEEDTQVDEAEYRARLHALYPVEQGIYPQQYYMLDDICSIIKTGDVSSAGHRYEFVVEDVTWDEAAAKCREKGGYLATILSSEEMARIQTQMVAEKKTDITFLVGAKDRVWLERGTDPLNLMSLYTVQDFWADEALKPKLRPQSSGGASGSDYVALLYSQAEERCYLDEIPDDKMPSYSGKTGYICEYDSQ